MDLLIFALILVGIVVLIMFLQFINARRDDRLYLKQLNDKFGSTDRSSYDRDRISLARVYHSRHLTDEAMDDITWSDLFMDDIFADVDRTESDAGAQVLYHLLRTPLYDADRIRIRRELIDHFRSESDERNAILMYLHHAGKPIRESVYTLLDSLKGLEPPKIRAYIIRVILLALSVLSMYFIPGLGSVLFVVVLVSNLYVYYRDRTKHLPYLRVFANIIALMDAAEEILTCIGKSSDPILKDMEKDIRKTLDDLKDVKSARVVLGTSGGNPLLVILSVIGIFIYLDIIVFWKIKDSVIAHEQDIDKLIGLCGNLDALISMAGYISSLGDGICIPEFADNNSKICIHDVYHPLIEDPVVNSIETDTSILLTGANASGKSTFLRSIALSMLYSQVFGYVPAVSYRAPLIRLMSAMSIHDDVTKGDSYYMAEIKAVKRMMDEYVSYKDCGFTSVCFVDELLSGTNTEERIAACTGILQSMNAEGIRVFAATHDIELTYLLADTYTNYHFREDLSDGDVRFSYKLQDGPATSRNAIRLLEVLGFDRGIVDKAAEMVERHGKEGIWSCS